MQYFKQILDKANRFRKSTCRNYHKAWRLFNECFIKLDQKPTQWEHRLVLYVTYFMNKWRKPSTIKSYISGIKAVLEMENIYISSNNYQLAALMKACKIRDNVLTVRLPIQKSLLELVMSRLDNYFSVLSQPTLKTLYLAT